MDDSLPDSAHDPNIMDSAVAADCSQDCSNKTRDVPPVVELSVFEIQQMNAQYLYVICKLCKAAVDRQNESLKQKGSKKGLKELRILKSPINDGSNLYKHVKVI